MKNNFKGKDNFTCAALSLCAFLCISATVLSPAHAQSATANSCINAFSTTASSESLQPTDKSTRHNRNVIPAFPLGAVSTKIDVETNTVIGRKDPNFHSIMVEPYYQGIEKGLAADLITNGSFEGPTNSQRMPEGWSKYPNARLNNVEFRADKAEEESVPQAIRNGELSHKQHSLRLEFDNYKEAKNGMARGIAQHEVPLEDGREYIVSFWAKSGGRGYDGNIKLAFGPPGEEQLWYDEATVAGISPEWKEFKVVLKPSIPGGQGPKKQDRAAWFVMSFEGGHQAGSSFLFVDHVSILPKDNVGLVRKDVFELLKKLRTNTVRYGGIATSFLGDYFDVIGIQGSRLHWFNGWQDTLQSAQFGYQEFYELSKNLNAPPTITVNLHGENALEKTMDFLSYSFDSPTVGFGQFRASLGHPDPVSTDTVIVELANEPWLAGFERERPINPAFIEHRDPVAYANKVNQFADAIRAKYPNVKIVAAGERDPSWNEPVIAIAGKNIWGLAVHWYLEWHQRDHFMAQPAEVQKVFDSVQATNKTYNGDKELKIAFNEWNSRLPMPYQHGMEASVHVASVWNVLLKNSPTVTTSANAMTVNGYPGNLINSNEWGESFVTPIYLQNLLYQRRSGPNVVATHVDGLSQNVHDQNIPYVDVAATKSEDGKRVYIYAINRNYTEDITTELNLTGIANVRRVHWEIIRAENLETRNTFQNPNAIKIEQVQAPQGSGQMKVTLPKHSISVFTVQLL